MWDKVEVMVPGKWFQPYYQDRDIAAAMELIGKPHVPTEKEKAEAHQRVLDFAEEGLPNAFFCNSGDKLLEIYPQKVLPGTWETLADCDVVRHRQKGGPSMTQPMALSMMNLLADCCAGKTKSGVTDQQAAYNIVTALFSSSTDNREEKPERTEAEVLVSCSIRALNTKPIPLERIINFRRREEQETRGHDLRALRRRYAERLESQLAAIAKALRNSSMTCVS